MMAAAAKREARKRRILENSEDRLKKILGNRPTRRYSSNLYPESSGSPASEFSSASVEENVDVVFEDRTTKARKRLLENSPFETHGEKDIQDEENSESNTLDDEYETTGALSVQQTAQDVPHSVGQSDRIHGVWKRIFLIVVVACILVGRWAYINWQTLLSRYDKQRQVNSDKLVELKSESMIWPFFALQFLFLCLINSKQASHSATISVLTVVLQLCGIPVRLTNTVSFLVTAFLMALEDFVVFLFVVISLHHFVEHSISSDFLQHVLQLLGNN